MRKNMSEIEKVQGLMEVYSSLIRYTMKEQNLILKGLHVKLLIEREEKLKDLRSQVLYVEESIKGSEQ